MTHPPIKAPFELPQTEAAADWYEAGKAAHTAWRASVVDEMQGPEWDALTLTEHLQWMSAAEAACATLSHPAAQAGAVQAPIDMVLNCPKCGTQHVDASDATECAWPQCSCADQVDRGCIAQDVSWTNPPHRSHLCHGCGHIWRPADVPTNGVRAVKTTGKADSPIAALSQPATTEAGDGVAVAVINEWLHVPTMKLRAGEMSAQEVRTVIGVLGAVKAEVKHRSGTPVAAVAQPLAVLPAWWTKFLHELTLQNEDEVRADLFGVLEVCALDAIAALAASPSSEQSVEAGYADAFYELGKLMNIPAQPASPEVVWREQMLPRLRALLSSERQDVGGGK